ncbi:MAG: hypothetical protein ABI968_12900 [Acidobacteriota bacterium]
MRKSFLIYAATLLIFGAGISVALERGRRLETARAAASAPMPAASPDQVLMAIVTTFATGPLLTLADRFRKSDPGQREEPTEVV